MLHAVAFLAMPGQLWGLSHLATFPNAVGLSAVLLVLLLVFWSMTPRFPIRDLAFPNRKQTAAMALLAMVLFWFLSEGHHFFGDGYHIIRSRGMSVTFTRAPILVHATMTTVRWLESHGVSIEDGMRYLSIVAGGLSVYMLGRLAHLLGDDDRRRWFFMTLFATCGAMQLFFGHTEYYGLLAVPILFYLQLSTLAIRGPASGWPAAIVFPLLLGMHLSALGLVPMHVYVLWNAWRRGDRRWIVLGTLLGLVLVWWVVAAVRSDSLELAGQVASGLKGYTAPYFNEDSTRHAFGLLSPEHLWALLNDLLLMTPLALVLLPFALRRQSPRAQPGSQSRLANVSTWAWTWALLGCLGVNVLFNREIGIYRDWDTLAPYAFVLVIWLGSRSVSRFSLVELPRATAGLFFVGIFHLLSWTVMNTNLQASERHFRLALTQQSLWSRYARSYIHEEFAIHYRDLGDLQTSFEEYKQASMSTPTDARYHVGAGNVAVRLGDWKSAVDSYEEAIKYRPDYLPAHNNLAGVLAMVGRDLDKAERHVRRAVELDSNSVTAWKTYYEVAMLRNDPTAAVLACQQVLRLQPDDVEARQRLQALQQDGGP